MIGPIERYMPLTQIREVVTFVRPTNTTPHQRVVGETVSLLSTSQSQSLTIVFIEQRYQKIRKIPCDYVPG